MDNLNILVIEGTDRPGRQSIKVAELVTDIGNKIEGINVSLVDPVDFDFSYAEGDPKYNELVKEADAFLIVTPEYNHGFPGTLKTLLDTQLKNYIHKPVLVAGVSTGPWGGIRAIQSLLPTLRELGMTITFSDLYFPKVKDMFDEEGRPKNEATVARIKDSYTELIWMARTMKWGRENLASKHHAI